MKKFAFIVAIALPALVMFSCAGPEKVGSTGTMDPMAEWWDNPGAVKDRLAAVGTARHLGNLAQSRTSAEARGRAQLAATLKSKIQQLVEDWAKSAGDLKVKESISSLVNNETFTRQLVDTTIYGGRVVKYKTIGENVHCLIILEPEMAKKWFKQCSDNMANQVLRDETLFKTEALKSQARDRLDKSIENEKAKYQKSYNKVTGS